MKQNGDFAYFADRACKNWKGNIDLQTVSKVVRKDNKKLVRISFVYIYHINTCAYIFIYSLVLHTPQRKWYLLSNNRIELDHWQQLLMFCVTTERNKKKKGNNNISNKYNKQPLPLKQSHSDNRWTKEAALNLNHKHNKNIIEGEGNGETQEAMPINNEPKNLNLPAFNPAYQMQIKDEVKDDVKEVDKMNKSSHQAQHSAIIEYYYDEGSSPAYLAKTIDMAEAKCYKNSYLCIWKIAEKACYDESEYDENEEESEEFSNSFIAGKDKDISDDDEKETLQILMGTKMNDDHSRMELYIFGGDRIIADHGPIDGAIRLFRDETAQVLDKTICGQIKQSLATDKDRQMFWSGNESKSVTYFYNMEYDYELVESYNEFKGIEHLYFRKLYWINWEDIYQYSIVYQADPQPIIIEKQKCYIHDSVCQLMLNNDVESHFRLIMTADVGNQNDQMRNDQVQNDKARDSEQEEEQGEEQEEEQEQEKAEDMMHDNNNNNDEFDPYGLASAPKMSIASFAYNSGSGLLNGDHDHLKKYRWQWDSMCFSIFAPFKYD